MRGWVILIAAAALVLASVQLGAGATGRRPRPARPSAGTASLLPIGCTRGGPPFRTHGPQGRKRIAIGFDDGPGDYTQKMLRVLRSFDSHATFFEIGQEISGRHIVMRKVLAQGNEIGNHTLHHELNPSSRSLAETNRLIKEATGFRPCDFRPPGGHVNQGLIDRATAKRLITIKWDVDPRDWADPGASAIASNVIDHAHNGSIVVMHDGGGSRSQTVAALPVILSHFRDRGYRFVTVTELLGHHFTYPQQGTG